MNRYSRWNIHDSSKRHALSRVEVACVIAVIAILLAILMPVLLSIRECSRQTVCQNHLRQLGTALQTYHDVHQSFPPAAIWSTEELRSLALHQSRRFDLFDQANWTQLLLRHLSMQTGEHHQRLAGMTCPSDSFNRGNNAFVFEPTPEISLTYGRGNYAMNAGSNCFDHGDGSTAFLTGDHAHLEIDNTTRSFRMWGNGMGGFNVSFSLDDFTNGSGSMIALEEVRSGVHPLDPRGVWSLGQIGGSITWAHGVNGDDYGPNNQHRRSDDIINCGSLHQAIGTKQLTKLRMPCVSYIDQNFQATSRSMHPGGVHVLLLDGSARFLADSIDPGLWHVLHSRETPQGLIPGDFNPPTSEKAGSQDESPSEREVVDLARTTKDLESLTNSIGMTFVKVPGGTFLMGRPDHRNELDLPPEAPPHPVQLTSPYYMGAYEVTRQQWRTVMEGDEAHELSLPEFPVTNISWDQAFEFCEKLSTLKSESLLGRHYRLPTEAEWEFAARGANDVAYDWHQQRQADDLSGEAAGILPPLPLLAVGSYPGNELGLFDMRGNAWEWCGDWFSRDYYSRSPVMDPEGPVHGYFKVVRGSDWTFVGEGCKISYPMLPVWKSSAFVGFRVVLETLPASVDSEGTHE